MPRRMYALGTALGWLSPETFLVAVGGGGEPMDLLTVNVTDGAVGPLVYGVTAAATRVPAPTPPPALPERSRTGSGFG
jgi:hypothetical protein